MTDRDWYVNEDPAHQQFKTEAAGHVEAFTVIDFTPGVWNKQ